MAPVALLSLSALVAAKLSEARVAPAASLPMAAAQPTIDLDESIAALAARGGAPCTTCKEKDDLVAAVMAVLDD